MPLQCSPAFHPDQVAFRRLPLTVQPCLAPRPGRPGLVLQSRAALAFHSDHDAFCLLPLQCSPPFPPDQVSLGCLPLQYPFAPVRRQFPCWNTVLLVCHGDTGRLCTQVCLRQGATRSGRCSDWAAARHRVEKQVQVSSTAVQSGASA